MGKCTYILAQPCGNSTGRILEMPPHGLGVGSEIRRAGHGVHWPAGKGQSRWQGQDGSKAGGRARDDTSIPKQDFVRTRLRGKCGLGLLSVSVASLAGLD